MIRMVIKRLSKDRRAKDIIILCNYYVPTIIKVPFRKGVNRKYLFWIFLLLLGVGGVFYYFRYVK